MVIAIMSILAALLLPVLSKAIATARQTDCMNRLKQVYVGAVAYQDENNELPRSMGSASTNWATWNRYIHGGPIKSSASYTPYQDYTVESYVPRAVFLCPVHLSKNPDIDTWSTRGSYRLNGHYLSQPIKLPKIRRASEVILTGDSGHTGYGDIFKRTTANSVSDWHDGKTNLLYFDGHVESWIFDAIPFHETWWAAKVPWTDP